MTSMYETYKTDKDLERGGVWFDFGDYRVKLARAGGANKKFARVIEAKTQPYKRAIQTNTMDPEVDARIMREAYVEAIILGWEVRLEEMCDDDKPCDPPVYRWEAGVHAEDGSVLPFNTTTVTETVEKLPDLFNDLQGYANEMASYRDGLLEADAGN